MIFTDKTIHTGELKRLLPYCILTKIKISNLYKSFGNNEVLKGIDFSMEKGEVVAINTMHPGDQSLRNYNYSIPINYFIKVANFLVTNRSAYVNAKLDMDLKAICDYSLSEVIELDEKDTSTYKTRMVNATPRMVIILLLLFNLR